MGFELLEEPQQKQKKIGNGANVEGQIKIDLSVDKYEIECPDNKYKKRFVKVKAPTLKFITSTLKKTGAKVLRMSSNGKYTIIDYTA